MLSNFINRGKGGHEVTREILFANILILITKFIVCGFICTCSYKGLGDNDVKIRMRCFSSQVLFKALYELSKRLIVVACS